MARAVGFRRIRRVSPTGRAVFFCVSSGQLCTGSAQLRLKKRVFGLKLPHTRCHSRAVHKCSFPFVLQGLQHVAHGRLVLRLARLGRGAAATPIGSTSPSPAISTAASTLILGLAEKECDEAGLAGNAPAHWTANLCLEPLLDMPTAECVPAARRHGRRGVVEANSALDRHERRGAIPLFRDLCP